MSYGRLSLLGLLALVGSAQPVRAQDSIPAQEMGTAEIRQRIEERFSERVKLELGLDDAQTAKLRPGVAANSDSVSRIVSQLLDLKVKYAESYREENKQLGFLTPVQRAQYYSLRERLLDALKQARQLRRAGGGGQRPGRP